MHKRISIIRKYYDLTQEAFAARINLSRNYVWMMENGDRAPSDRTISDICREFDVNETWLRTGEGEMFIKKTRSQEIADFFADLMVGEDDFKTKLIAVLARTGPEEWLLMEKFARRLADEIKDEEK